MRDLNRILRDNNTTADDIRGASFYVRDGERVPLVTREEAEQRSAQPFTTADVTFLADLKITL